MAKIIKGNDLRLEVGQASGEKKIYASTGCEFSIDSEMKETLHKDNTGGWATFNPDKKSATLSCESLFVMEESGFATIHDMYDYLESGTEVDFKFTTGVVGEIEYSGKAYVKSVKISGPLDDNATASVELQPSGPVTKTTIAAKSGQA